LALTLIEEHVLSRLVDGIKKIHKIEISEMKDPSKLAEEVTECIKFNST